MPTTAALGSLHEEVLRLGRLVGRRAAILMKPGATFDQLRYLDDSGAEQSLELPVTTADCGPCTKGSSIPTR